MACGVCTTEGSVKWRGKIGYGLTNNLYCPPIGNDNCSTGRWASHKKQGRSDNETASTFEAVERIRAGLYCKRTDTPADFDRAHTQSL